MNTRRMFFAMSRASENPKQLRADSPSTPQREQSTLTRRGRVATVNRANGARVETPDGVVSMSQVGHTALTAGRTVRYAKDSSGDLFILA